MRQNIRDFVDAVAQTLPIGEPIYEFGSFRVEGQEEIANLRPLFPGKEYVGCDLRPGPGVDRVLDLHKIDLPDATAGTVLCLDTLEHVEYCHQAVSEMHRILREGGICVLSSVMLFPIHEHPHDFWRFTPDGFRSLLRPFTSSYVGWDGDPRFPHTVVGIGAKGTVDWDAFVARWDANKENDAMRLLNIGAGPKGCPIPPWYHDWEVVRLDIEPANEPDLLMDAMDLDTLEAGQFDAVYGSHMLEHVYTFNLARFLGGVRHVLKADGFCEFRVPNALAACGAAAKAGSLDAFCYQSAAGAITAWDMLYSYLPFQMRYGEPMVHKNGFSPATLQATLEEHGFPLVYSAGLSWDITAIGCLTDLSGEMKRRMNIDYSGTVHPDNGGTDVGAVRQLRPVAELALQPAPGDNSHSSQARAPAAGGRGPNVSGSPGSRRRLRLPVVH